jgi:hypothetical protein
MRGAAFSGIRFASRGGGVGQGAIPLSSERLNRRERGGRRGSEPRSINPVGGFDGIRWGCGDLGAWWADGSLNAELGLGVPGVGFAVGAFPGEEVLLGETGGGAEVGAAEVGDLRGRPIRKLITLRHGFDHPGVDGEGF